MEILKLYKDVKPIVIEENISINRLDYLIKHYNIISKHLDFSFGETQSNLETLIKLKSRKSQIVKFIPNNRFIHTTQSVQNLRREFRSYIIPSSYIDIDIEKCHYVIFCFIAKEIGIKLKKFKATKNILEKKTIYKILNCGDDNGFTEASNEIKIVINKLIELNPSLYKEVQKEKGVNYHNLKGAFISRILCRIETVLIYHIIQFFRKHNIKISTLMFDGFFINENDTLIMFDKLFKQTKSYIKKMFGIEINLVIKHHKNILENINIEIEKYKTVKRDDKYVRYTDLEVNVKNVIIQAQLGLGKSTASRNFLKQNSFESIIVITPRRTYSKSVVKELQQILPDILHYQNTKSNCISVPNVVIQFESLRRLNINSFITKKLLIMMDECEATFTQLTSSETNKINHTENIQNFLTLYENASKVIFMDGFVSYSKKVLHFLTTLKQQYKFFHYVTKPQIKFKQKINSSKFFKDKLIELLKKGKKILLFSTSKYYLEKQIEPIVKKNNIKSAFYWSKRNDTELKDINNEWINYNFVAYNSSITIGIDFTRTHFDYIFFYATQKSQNLIRDCAQALYRDRKCKNLVYHINCNDFTNLENPFYTTFEEQTKRLFKIKDDFYENIHNKYQINDIFKEKNWLRNLCIENKIEHLNSIYNLKEEIEKILKFNNYQDKEFFYEPEDYEELFSNDFFFQEIDDLELLKDFETQQKTQQEVLIDIYNKTKDIDIKTFKILVKKNNKTEDETNQISKFIFNKDMICAYNYPFYRNYRHIVKKIVYEMILRLKPEQILSHCKNTLNETRKMEFVKQNYINQIYNLIGIKQNSFSYPQNIKKKNINDLIKFLQKKKYIDICLTCDIPINSSKQIDTEHKAFTFINNVLKRYSVTLIEKTNKQNRQGKNRGNRTYNYTLIKNPDYKEYNFQPLDHNKIREML